MNETTPPDIDKLRKSIPRYELVSFLAKGGMGEVFLARDRGTGAKVAVKVLSEHLSNDKEFVLRFRQEAEVMSKLRHENLVNYVDFVEEKGKRYIVMEYIDGRSLHYSAHGDAIDPNVAFNITVGLCRGVKHAHDRGVIHRDIKPDNIFLTPNAIPKLGDFGLSRPLSYDETTQVIYATKGYSAPEVSLKPELVDKRADIFSIGVILYEMIVGELPNAYDYIHPVGLFPHLDPWYDIIIQKCIEPDPDLRYPSIKALFADLSKIQTPMYRHLLTTEKQLSDIIKDKSSKPPEDIELKLFGKKKLSRLKDFLHSK